MTAVNQIVEFPLASTRLVIVVDGGSTINCRVLRNRYNPTDGGVFSQQYDRLA